MKTFRRTSLFMLFVFLDLCLLLSCSDRLDNNAGSSSNTTNSISVVLKNANGQNVTGRVLLRPASSVPDPAKNFAVEFFADAKGYVSLPVDEGKWFLEGRSDSAEGIAWLQLTLDESDIDTVELQLSPVAVLSGQVDKSLLSRGSYWVGVGGSSIAVPVNEDGYFRLEEIPLGAWKVGIYSMEEGSSSFSESPLLSTKVHFPIAGELMLYDVLDTESSAVDKEACRDPHFPAWVESKGELFGNHTLQYLLSLEMSYTLWTLDWCTGTYTKQSVLGTANLPNSAFIYQGDLMNLWDLGTSLQRRNLLGEITQSYVMQGSSGNCQSNGSQIWSINLGSSKVDIYESLNDFIIDNSSDSISLGIDGHYYSPTLFTRNGTDLEMLLDTIRVKPLIGENMIILDTLSLGGVDAKAIHQLQGGIWLVFLINGDVLLYDPNSGNLSSDNAIKMLDSISAGWIPVSEPSF